MEITGGLFLVFEYFHVFIRDFLRRCAREMKKKREEKRNKEIQAKRREGGNERGGGSRGKGEGRAASVSNINCVTIVCR